MKILLYIFGAFAIVIGLTEGFSAIESVSPVARAVRLSSAGTCLTVGAGISAMAAILGVLETIAARLKPSTQPAATYLNPELQAPNLRRHG